MSVEIRRISMWITPCKRSATRGMKPSISSELRGVQRIMVLHRRLNSYIRSSQRGVPYAKGDTKNVFFKVPSVKDDTKNAFFKVPYAKGSTKNVLFQKTIRTATNRQRSVYLFQSVCKNNILQLLRVLSSVAGERRLFPLLIFFCRMIRWN